MTAISHPLKLYSYYRSSCSYRVRIALNIKNLTYEYFPVHLVKNGGEQHGSEFRSMNPKGEVPCLVHGTEILTQSMAIIFYLDQTFPSPRLFPQKSIDMAKVMQICECVNSGIQPIQNLAVMNQLENQFHVGLEEKTKWSHHWIYEGFSSLEKILESTHGQYCFGDDVTAADLFLVPQVYNAFRFKVAMEHFPIIHYVYNKACNLEAFQKAAPEQQPDYEL